MSFFLISFFFYYFNNEINICVFVYDSHQFSIDYSIFFYVYIFYYINVM